MSLKNKQLIDRLLLLINELAGGKKNKFAEMLGVKPEHINNWVNRGSAPNAEALEKLYKNLNVNVHWLLTGEGEKYYTKFTGVVMRGSYRIETDATAEEPPVDIKDIPMHNMHQWLDEYWKDAGEKERAWLEIEFQRSFPEFKEWLKKQQSQSEDDDTQANKIEKTAG